MICIRCNKEIDEDKLKLIDKENFEAIGHRQEDNELCDKCFKQHEKEIKEYLEANKNG